MPELQRFLERDITGQRGRDLVHEHGRRVYAGLILCDGDGSGLRLLQIGVVTDRGLGGRVGLRVFQAGITS